MSVCAVVPMRHDSERVRGKNYRILGDRPLFHHIIGTLQQVPAIDEIVIDTDSSVVRESAASAFPHVRVVERPPDLRAGDISMNEVLLNTIRTLDHDVLLQTHSTNPFLTAKSIASALQLFGESNDADSLFSVTRLQARLWDSEVRPLNHDPDLLLRTQDLAPVFLENSCLYVFTGDTLSEHRSRIGARPVVLELGGFEALDIDTEDDFELAGRLWAAMKVTSA